MGKIIKFFDMTEINVKKIREETSLTEINKLLSEGWELLTMFFRDNKIVHVLIWID